MRQFLTVAMWAGRVALDVAETAVRARRTLDQLMNNNPWMRPPWGGKPLS